MKKSKKKTLCMDCDGIGWVEGGITIKTTCKTCKGKGEIKKKKL
jgi:DnaJ-class molecular chaperone